jgi:hypothetical protein
MTPAFVVTELIFWLNQELIVRPGYTPFWRSPVPHSVKKEKAALVEAGVADDIWAALRRLPVRDESLTELAAIKQAEKYFDPRMMGASG